MVLSSVFEFLQHIRNAKAHPSMAHLPLIGSPWPVAMIVGVYLFFVFKWGPAHMETREPYNLKKVLLAYNLAQIVMCALFNYYTIWGITIGHSYDLGCMTIAPNDHPYKYIEIGCSYAYFVFKIIDLLDTVFFVLRKSYRQVTFLHVYHHVLMVAFTYYYFTYYGVMGHLGSVAIINSIVHFFMYIYYFASTFSPNMKNSIRIKKSITIMQLTQFVLIVAHQVYPLLFRPDCQYPKFFLYFGALQAVVMIILFGQFYKKAYLQPNAAPNGDLKVPKCILSTGVKIDKKIVAAEVTKID